MMGWRGLALFLWPATTLALTPQDFSAGLELQAEAQRPIQSLILPEAVYAGVTRANLSDLRVFNAQGLPVPHALCPGRILASDVALQRVLPLFSLAAGALPAASGGALELDLPGGSRLRLVEPGSAKPQARTAAWIVDLQSEPAEALELDWQAAAETAEIVLQIRASNDLDQWRTVLARTTLLHGSGPGGELRRSRLTLPVVSERYLRLETLGSGPQPRIDRVRAHWRRRAPEPELQRFSAPLHNTEGGWIFDAGRLAPVQRAWPRLPMPNMLMRIAIDSRASPAQDWRNRWTGEAYELLLPDGETRSAVAQFAAVSERWWRLRVLRGADSLGDLPVQLDLAYHAASLRFLAQGEGPYTLAFGSVRAGTQPPSACGDLLAAAGGGSPAELIGQARIGGPPQQPLGGQAVLQTPPPPRPWRQYLLWTVLLTGALVLLLLARDLLHRLRDD